MASKRMKANDFPPEVLGLFDKYVHGMIDRRGFLDGAAKFATGGLTAVAMFEALRPRYAWARQVEPDDARIRQDYVEYDSPAGSGTMRGYMARPAGAGARAAVLVIHENRGLNPYVEDVVRRFAAADFLAFGPDALTPLGGYPGNDDDGREMQSRLERDTMVEDFHAAAEFLMGHSESTGRVGAVGFCFGGGVVGTLATRLPDLGAGVPFYGSQPPAEAVPAIRAPLMIQYAGLDERINQGWPAFDAALSANGKTYSMHMYGGVNHGFHNDTTPRYDQAAASLAQARTIDFFDHYLR
ncbi:MAG: dienelactone hydrolase family protein [Gammaproteobacteria bacterium]|nr:dienelactone hydrolase family protein [Gammaproteobacteria bacterium]MDE0248791.1 dienelactone hydrolase family protein [Gammaproteobacteria bacterium]